jgi:hypothetical protein
LPGFEVPVPSPRRRRLLDAKDDAKDYAPWVRAKDISAQMHLFWLPASSFPMRLAEKQWLTEFLARLETALARDFALRCEIFFQYKQITGALADPFRAYSPKCMKLLGLGRHGETDQPSMPDADHIKALAKSGQDIPVQDWIADYLLWFITKQPKEQRQLLLGEGGMLTLFLPADPKTTAPVLPVTPALRAAMPVFQKMDVDGIVAGAFATRDAFLDKSKQLFGAGLETRPEYPGIPFILPLLDSSKFFSASEEIQAKWFDLFHVYVNESKKDKGVLLAFQKQEYEEVLLNILESLSADGLSYSKE